MQSHHPFLIYYRSIDIDRYFKRNLYWNFNLFLYYLLHCIINVDWFVNINRFIDIYRFFHFNINRLFNNLGWSCFNDLDWNLLFNLYNFLYDSLRALDIFRYLNSDLYRFLYNNLFDGLFWHSSILIFQLFFKHLNLH